MPPLPGPISIPKSVALDEKWKPKGENYEDLCCDDCGGCDGTAYLTGTC